MNQNNVSPKPAPAQRSPRSFSAWKSLQSILVMALLIATLFTFWTPANVFANDMLDKMFRSAQPAAIQLDFPTATPAPHQRIGIVSGHYKNDSGATCPDGLTEASVNFKIATLVQNMLVKEGYDVDLLAEKDARLTEYQASVLVSIHNDSCDYINPQATGFKVAAASGTRYPERADRLTSCLTQRYAAVTGLPFHAGSITIDMKEYHAFNEIHADTTAAIIETGFLNLNRVILTDHTDRVAQGVTSGILCYLRNENATLPASPVLPTPTNSPVPQP